MAAYDERSLVLCKARVLYKLMSTSRPLLTWKNLTIGTLAVVIGKTFRRPRRKYFVTKCLY